MKKDIMLVIVIAISLFSIAFSQIVMTQEQAAPTTHDEKLLMITGEIIELERGRFLLQDSSNHHSFNQVWISSNSTDSLKIGQTVSVWVNFVDASDPAQATAMKIED